MVLGVGGFIVFYELDLFYTVYYFFVKPKTKIKSILNILSNLTLLLIFSSDYTSPMLYMPVSQIFGEEIILVISLFFAYIVLRIVCATVSVRKSNKED